MKHGQTSGPGARAHYDDWQIQLTSSLPPYDLGSGVPRFEVSRA